MDAYVAELENVTVKAMRRRKSLELESGLAKHKAEIEIKSKQREAEEKAMELLLQASKESRKGSRYQNMLKFQAAMIKQQTEWECERIRRQSDFESKQLFLKAQHSMNDVHKTAEKTWDQVKKDPIQAPAVKNSLFQTLGPRRASIVVEGKDSN